MTKGRVVATVVVDLCYPYDMPIEKAKKILSDTYVDDIKAKLTDGLSFKHETVNVHGQYADLYIVTDEAETGNRKNKVKPEKDWLGGIVNGCAEHNIPLFMKESLRNLMGSDFRQEFPWEAEQ